MLNIQKAAVIGAGTMGAQIAAHLATSESLPAHECSKNSPREQKRVGPATAEGERVKNPLRARKETFPPRFCSEKGPHPIGMSRHCRSGRGRWISRRCGADGCEAVTIPAPPRRRGVVTTNTSAFSWLKQAFQRISRRFFGTHSYPPASCDVGTFDHDTTSCWTPSSDRRKGLGKG